MVFDKLPAGDFRVALGESYSLAAPGGPLLRRLSFTEMSGKHII
jgi:hypothetical protein